MLKKDTRIKCSKSPDICTFSSDNAVYTFTRAQSSSGHKLYTCQWSGNLQELKTGQMKRAWKAAEGSEQADMLIEIIGALKQ
jgi:hypothetical protein